ASCAEVPENASRSGLPATPGTSMPWAIESVPSLHCQNDHAGQSGVSEVVGGLVVPVPLYQAIQNGCSPATVDVQYVFALDLLTYMNGRTPSAATIASEKICTQFETNVRSSDVLLKSGMLACSTSI